MDRQVRVIIILLYIIKIALDVYLAYYRLREQYGTVRVSTAYQFYLAVKQHLELDETSYAQKEKPIFAATSYKLYYVAADAVDAIGKEDDVALILDREKMWDCSLVQGSSRCYEFIGQPEGDDGKLRITKRYLPCPCCHCLAFDHEHCRNPDIVLTTTTSVIKVKEIEECPDILDVPLEQYKNDLLKSFIKMYHANNKCPSELLTKALLINYITRHFSEFVNFAAVNAR